MSFVVVSSCFRFNGDICNLLSPVLSELYSLCFRVSGLQVPAFVYSTSHIPEERSGTEYSGMMHVTDWLPTIASAAGIVLDGG